MLRLALKVVLVIVGAFVILIFPAFLPLWLAALFVRRRRRGQPGLPRLPFLTRPGRIAFFVFGWLGLLLVTIELVASSFFNAVDEHVAPVLAFFVMLGLFVIVAADVALQVVVHVVRALVPRLRLR